MSLDVKVLQALDSFAVREVGDNIKDGQALAYINKLRLDGSHIYLASEYRKYYFKAKQHYREEYENKK